MSLLLLFRPRKAVADGATGDDMVGYVPPQPQIVAPIIEEIIEENQAITLKMEDIEEVLRKRKITEELSNIISENMERLALTKNLADLLVLVQLLRYENPTLGHWTDDDLLTVLLLSS